MPTPDYSIYLPTGAGVETWGVGVSAAGHTRIRPGTPYPPGSHPAHHALSWDRGRILRRHQVVYISQGSGRFESSIGGKRKITEGSVFLLFPGVWHRYQPDPDAGWVEDWIELVGPTMHRLTRKAIITPKRPIFRIGLRAEILNLFDRCHDLARSAAPRHQPVLGSVGLQILAQVNFFAANAKREPSKNDIAIRRSQAMIAGAVDRPLRMEQIADEVGMSYSYFRRAFKQQTGVSPKQYHLQLRLRKVQEMLNYSSASVKEIAQAMGFDSAFHLSADFKARTGIPPTRWRERLAGATNPRPSRP
jgi:AraC-like DNA-binding protein